MISDSALLACRALGEIADALDDMALFEKATLLHSSSPNPLQMEQFVLFALEKQRFDRAAYWLLQDWQGYREIQALLKIELLRQQGAWEAMSELMTISLKDSPNPELLDSMLERVSVLDLPGFRDSVLDIAENLESPSDAIEMALLIDAQEQATLWLQKYFDDLKTLDTSRLQNWHSLSTDPLAQCVCIRLIILEMFRKDQTFDQHLLIDSLNLMIALDEVISDYKNLTTCQQFVETLKNEFPNQKLLWEKL